MAFLLDVVEWRSCAIVAPERCSAVAETLHGGCRRALRSAGTMHGDGVTNEQMRNKLNAFDYGSAIIPLKDSNFLTNLNTYKPASYPEFTQASVEASNPSP